MNLRSRLVINVLEIGIVCLPILGYLMPYLDDGVSEAKRKHAWREIRARHESPEIPKFGVGSSETDPWGEPWRNQSLPNGDMRILSTGPNRSTTPEGPDEDDIYSDMPESPVDTIHRQKTRQSLVALGAFALAWAAASALFLWERRPIATTDHAR